MWNVRGGRTLAAMVFLLLLAGCASTRQAPPAGEPVPEFETLPETAEPVPKPDPEPPREFVVVSGPSGAGKSTRTKAEYRMRTHLIHGNFDSKKWDYDHHVVPPMLSSATYRLSSAHRGAQGFFEFASDTMDFAKHVPIYIYDRLEEPTRGMLEENLAYAEGGKYVPVDLDLNRIVRDAVDVVPQDKGGAD